MRMLQDTSVGVRHGSLPEVNRTVDALQKQGHAKQYTSWSALEVLQGVCSQEQEGHIARQRLLPSWDRTCR